MRKYQGEVIATLHDELGPLEVVEDGHTRSLHFGTDAKQSSMLLRDPIQLALSYTRAMSCALLLCEAPRRFLLIGLGGGSLAKFLLHHFPQCHIDAVEYRPEVLRAAQEYFALPASPRLNVIIDDAARFIRQADIDEYGHYDVIFVDAFLGHGISNSVIGISFYEACRMRLADNGVMSKNLWSGSHISARDMLQDIGDSFDGNSLKLPVEGKENIIALAGNGLKLKNRLKKLEQRAAELERQTDVEYVSMLRALRRENSWFSF